MIDQAEVNRQCWLSVVRAKRFWFPVLMGTLLGINADTPFAWIGWATVLIAVGVAAWRLTWGRQTLIVRVITQLKRKESREQRAFLRGLQRKLRQDRDSRTGDMLRRLRKVYDRVVELDLDKARQQPWRVEVYDQVCVLYRSCLSALERSFDLWIRANEMATDESRLQVLQWRNELLNQVNEGVQQLEKSLDQLQASALKYELPQAELLQVRSELEQGLEVARQVEKRLESFEQTLQVPQDDL